MFSYIKNSYAELRKVTWPKREAAIQSTLIVIGFSVVVAVILGTLDFAFSAGFNYLITLAV